MITITETLYKKMPDDIKACFNQLPNPSSEEVRECFPEQKSGARKAQGYQEDRNLWNKTGGGDCEASSGNASRFFKSIIYQAKASKSERNKGCEGLEEKDSMKWAGGNEMKGLAGTYPDGTPKPIQIQKNNHPTVKPIALMEYLIRMVTKEGGTVLDPFMGSGSTGVACVQNGFDFIGIEREAGYIKIAEARINSIQKTLRKIKEIKVIEMPKIPDKSMEFNKELKKKRKNADPKTNK